MRNKPTVKQSIPKELRYSMRDFNNEFPNDAACLEYIKQQRWPGGMTRCAKCGVERRHYRVGNRTAYACDHCGHHIYPLAGTIFEHSSTPLRLWFYAAYLMGSTRCGISAKQIQRETDVTYKTAWRMFHQIRSVLSDGDLQLEGPTVEVDETDYGGVRKYGFGRPMRGDKKKTPIVGIVQRRGKAIAKVVNRVTAKKLVGLIRKHVVPGNTVYTNEYASYDTVAKGKRYVHRRINHSEKTYVVGDIHTNSIEGHWSLIKHGIGGVYHSVSRKHRQSYLDEYCFRYNRRHMGNQQFRAILERASRQV
jgi:transposase-like protein